MTDLGAELGVQSYCYRHFKDNATVARMIRESGLSRVELCGVHADLADLSKADEVIKIYKDAGVDIVAIGVQGFAGNEEAERPWFEFAKKAGAKTISAHFAIATVPQCFRTAEKLAAEYGIKVAIHNHGGWHWLGSAEVLADVFSKTSPEIGLCLDTAWALDSGLDPIAMVKQFGERLYGIHVKDFIFDRARKPEDVVVGTGNIDLAKLIPALRSVNFKGYAALEYEGDVENPVPALQKCLAAVQAAAAA